MPLIYTIKNKNFHLAVWKITESEAEIFSGILFSEREKKYFSEAKSEKRRLEWLAVRQLLKIILVDTPFEVIYDEFGKPKLDDSSQHISISHSREYVAVIASKEKIVGIDIEKTEPRIHSIAHKFINEQELLFLGDEPSTDQLILIWCMKETLFKLYGKGEVDFRKNLFVEEFKLNNQGTAQASIVKDDYTKSFRMHYEMREDSVLVYSWSDEG